MEEALLVSQVFFCFNPGAVPTEAPPTDCVMSSAVDNFTAFNVSVLSPLISNFDMRLLINSNYCCCLSPVLLLLLFTHQSTLAVGVTSLKQSVPLEPVLFYFYYSTRKVLRAPPFPLIPEPPAGGDGARYRSLTALFSFANERRQ